MHLISTNNDMNISLDFEPKILNKKLSHDMQYMSGQFICFIHFSFLS